MSALDAKIDQLYQLALDEFTAARNALAKSLTGADAALVKRLAKPTAVPWAVNQVYWHARPVFDRTMKAGAAFRKAQIGALEGRPADVAGATHAHRLAIADAAREAQRLASALRSTPNADAVMRTFEALSLTGTPDPPGRLTQELQPVSGFEALAGVTPKAQPVGLKPDTAEAAPNAPPQPDPKRLAAIKAAEEEVARAEQTERSAREEWQNAKANLEERRRTLATLKSEV